jgi:hypothetical protein
MRRLITCGLAALTLCLSAVGAFATQLYRWVDAQGVVHYSDQPQPGAEKIQVQNAQTYKAPPPPKQSASAVAKPEDGGGTYQCQIVSPTPEQSFFNPETVAIQVAVIPAVVGSDQIVVTVDVASPERGAHTINMVVRGADGKTACNPASLTFNVERPSLLSPQSQGHH